jgi:hypothetical protein
VGLYEVVPIDEEMREMVAHHASLVELTRRARRPASKASRHDGMHKVLEGARATSSSSVHRGSLRAASPRVAGRVSPRAAQATLPAGCR